MIRVSFAEVHHDARAIESGIPWTFRAWLANQHLYSTSL